jgi:hypothetical protein
MKIAAAIGFSAAILGLSVGTASAAPCLAIGSGTTCVQVTEYITVDMTHTCVLFEVNHLPPQYAVPIPALQEQADTLKLYFMSGMLISFSPGTAIPAANCGYLQSYQSAQQLVAGDKQ